MLKAFRVSRIFFRDDIENYGMNGNDEVAPGFYKQTVGEYIDSLNAFVDGYKEIGLSTTESFYKDGKEWFPLYNDQEEAERVAESLQRCIDKGYLTEKTFLGTAAGVLLNSKVSKKFINDLSKDDLLIGPHAAGLTNRKKELVGSITAEDVGPMSREDWYRENAAPGRENDMPDDYSGRQIDDA